MATLNANPIVYHQKANIAAAKRRFAWNAAAEEETIREEEHEPFTAEEVFGQPQRIDTGRHVSHRISK